MSNRLGFIQTEFFTFLTDHLLKNRRITAASFSITFILFHLIGYYLTLPAQTKS